MHTGLMISQETLTNNPAFFQPFIAWMLEIIIMAEIAVMTAMKMPMMMIIIEITLTRNRILLKTLGGLMCKGFPCCF